MFTNMKVAVRLGLGFGLLITLMITLIVVNMSRMEKMQGYFHDVVDKSNVEIKLSIAMRGSIRDIATAIRNIVLVTEADEVKHERQRVDDQRKLFDKNEELLTRMVDSQEEKAILVKIKEYKAPNLLHGGNGTGHGFAALRGFLGGLGRHAVGDLGVLGDLAYCCFSCCWWARLA